MIQHRPEMMWVFNAMVDDGAQSRPEHDRKRVATITFAGISGILDAIRLADKLTTEFPLAWTMYIHRSSSSTPSPEGCHDETSLTQDQIDISGAR